VGNDGSLAADAPVVNAYAFWPPMRGLGRYYELTITCRGEADRVTGYFINIRDIDTAVRRAALPMISDAVAGRRSDDLGPLLRDMLGAIDAALNSTVVQVEWALSPTYRIMIRKDGAHPMGITLLTNEYEFSAAHRLHAPELSDEQNREIFGKCNHPSGHGHNYRVQVTVRQGTKDHSGPIVAVERLDELVDRVAIAPLDHKHLNVDVAEFKGMNTSVENIAKVVFEMLRGPVRELGVELEEVRVWETGKTSCIYRG
jgi:6-pyruvoyltetrahydropterin/6-carboxytetrahydropterin synthase